MSDIAVYPTWFEHWQAASKVPERKTRVIGRFQRGYEHLHAVLTKKHAPPAAEQFAWTVKHLFWD